MGESVKEGNLPEADHGLGPFFWFGVALLVGAIFALFEGLEYYNTPTFTSAALPSIAGVAVAVAAFLIMGWKAPANN